MKFGEQVTADHFFATNEEDWGCDCEMYGIVVYDVFSEWLEAQGVNDKSADASWYMMKRLLNTSKKEAVDYSARRQNP